MARIIKTDMREEDLVSVAKILKAHQLKAMKMLGMSLPEIAKTLINEAKAGNIRAAEYVFDRSMGKPSQEITGKDGGPVEIVVKWDGNGPVPGSDST